METKKFIEDRAHEAFDGYVDKLRKKSRMSLLAITTDQRYTVDYNCKYHPPYPAGSCQRCIPQSVILKRQEFRHVDYVSFMNFKEL